MKSLNPGYKLLTMILSSLLLSLSYNTRLNLLITAAALLTALLTPGVNRKRLVLTLLPFFLAALGMFMTGLLFPAQEGSGTIAGVWGSRTIYATSLGSAMKLASRILAYGSLGILFAFTTQSMALVMSLMQQFYLSPKFAYGILAAYHFFPVVCSEYATVKAALAVRGIHVWPFSPRRLYPMLTHALERSESLAMAMESRGFDDKAPRSVAFRVPFGARDIVFLLGTLSAIAAGLIFL